jgi:aspartate aminotransferase-like enzyme
MAEDYGVVVVGGLGSLKDKAFRVGHMGNVNRSDILATLSAVEGSFGKQPIGSSPDQESQPLTDPLPRKYDVILLNFNYFHFLDFSEFYCR